MKKKALGNTGIRVSEIAFGGVEIGMPYGIGVKGSADMPSKKEAVSLLHAAIEGGINFFDTARVYGRSEEIMGVAFRGKRDSVVISTKCKHLRDEQGVPPSSKKLKEIIEKSMEESLAALQTDYIDVYILHQADEEILQNETVAETFVRLREKGVIRATGASTYSVSETKKCIDSGHWDVVQLPFNLMDQSQGETFTLAHEKGVGIVVRSVLFKGILSNKGRHLHTALKDVERHVQLYKDFGTEHSFDIVTLAIKFALSYRQISSVLVGIDRLEYLKKAIAVADGNYLDKNTLEQLKTLRYPDPFFLDLKKWDKEGWLT